ncbi:MAG: hypothetical protein QFF03_04025 [Pseudomonadota bacterium]|nr:hypothetical protein [Pseudomonadota bacterium]
MFDLYGVPFSRTVEIGRELSNFREQASLVPLLATIESMRDAAALAPSASEGLAVIFE